MDVLPAYQIADVNQSGAFIEQLGQFEDILDEAEKKGMVHVLPSNEKETYNITNQRIRLQTIASRLFLLGYLPRKIRSRRLEAKLGLIKKAVLQFQKDAGLKEDSWVGDVTWYALDQLVSFESDFNFEQWFLPDGSVREKSEEAICRATQLRLWSLGLYGQKPRKKTIYLKKISFFKFSMVLRVLQIVDDQFKAGLNFETLKYLFDQANLTQSIRRSKHPNRDSFSLKLPKKNRSKHQLLFQKFVVNCAKIELWLLGYEMSIDGKNDFKYKKDSQLWNALAHYYQNFENKSKQQAERLALQITPSLFISLCAALEAGKEGDQDDASEEITKIMIPKDPKKASVFFQNAWDFIKDKGMRLWDGLKRVWGWIKRIGKKVVSFIDENIFKAFYRYVSKSFKIVKKGISAIVASFGVYASGKLQTEQVLYTFSKDMDIVTYFDVNTSVGDLEFAMSKLNRQAKSFNIGCRILGFVFYMFKNIVLGIFGWAKLLYTLLKSYKELRLLYINFKGITTI